MALATLNHLDPNPFDIAEITPGRASPTGRNLAFHMSHDQVRARN
jgi:hypothetical protein